MTSRRSGRPAVRPGADALAALRLVTETLADRKAIDPLVLDLRGLTGAADYFVIVSGTSDAHVRGRSEERRVGKECRCRWSQEPEETKEVQRRRSCPTRGA